MKLTILASILALAAACGGGGDDAVTADARIDGPAGQLCTGLPYDKCRDTTGWTDCMNGMECRFFMMDGITECTPACRATMPCPADQFGDPVACNNMGRCKANPPNSCTLP